MPNDLFKRPLLAVPHGPHGHPERTPSADVQCSLPIPCLADCHLPAFRLSTVLDDHTTVTLMSSKLPSPSSHSRIRSLYTTEGPRSVPPISGTQREADNLVMVWPQVRQMMMYELPYDRSYVSQNSRTVHPGLSQTSVTLPAGQSIWAQDLSQ